MFVKKMLMSVVLVVIVSAGLCCVSSCKERKAGGLAIVDSSDRPATQLKQTGLVIVTHGWIERARGDWPEDMAVAISEKTDPNLWLVGYFDWQKGARTINPADAAKFARDTAGAGLADQILSLDLELKHIHLLGHSSGVWLVSEAAKVLARKTDADIHLTFFDAYIPSGWDERQLGSIDVRNGIRFWADHYYTRDYTLGWTEYDLTFAHNVDITQIDQHIKDHNFPWKWYYATITGMYPKGHFLDDGKFTCKSGDIEYGFARSKAAGLSSWQDSLRLAPGNKAIVIPRKQPD